MSALFRFLSGICLAAWVACAASVEVAPPFNGEISLVRYDMPRGASDGFAPTRQLAKRIDGPNAVDWPDFTLNGKPVFRGGALETIELPVPPLAESKSYFQIATDAVIEPGNHWFRAMQLLPGRRHVYTADGTARAAAGNGDVAGRYELWTFPVRIAGEGAPVVKNVELKAGGAVVFNKRGPWRSLTLLLPANQTGKPYELMIDGRGPVEFNAGLQPVKLGDPREMIYPIDATLSMGGAEITVRNVTRPETFPNQREWDADVAALREWHKPPPLPQRDSASLARYLGIEVPRSPLRIYAAALPRGMSGGFYKQGARSFSGSLDEYAAYLEDQGFDAVFEHASALPAPDEADSFEQRAAAFARRGISFGLQYDNNTSRPSLANPGLAIFAHALPEWHAPLYRSLQVAAQRFAQLPNFIGFDIGAGDAGYAPPRPWVPAPQNPWGEAMIEFTGTTQPQVPRVSAVAAAELQLEQPVKAVDEFHKHVQRYEAAFRQYGYFAEAVRDVDARLIFSTASFGSAPGNGARGGWPWASLPGRAMFEGLNVQQAFDWNQTHAAKPLQIVALIDRLESYSPTRKTAALLDNFQFLYGREAWQRACALVLTRGIAGIGTNFLPGTSVDGGQLDVANYEKEMALWMRKYGGVYAATRPAAPIGIFYSQEQALLRKVVTGTEPKADDLYAGSHEGRVTEALFLCHAAGWPARVITYQEVMRGPLPESMKAILLVGLDATDGTWRWDAGLEPRLQEFIARGGRIIADAESVCAVPATRTDLKIAAYVAQSNVDPTPLLFARNAANIPKLRAAMETVPAPIATWDNPRLWAIPTECGNTQYITAINQSFAEGKESGEFLRPADPKATKPEPWKTKVNASLFVKPEIAALRWNTTRPIYDVRLGRKISAEEAARVDLTDDAFRWYALPAAEIVAPTVTFKVSVTGFYEATLAMTNSGELTGIPVSISIRGPHDEATVYGATGYTVLLPLNIFQDIGDIEMTVTELLSGLKNSVSMHLEIPPAKPTVSPADLLPDGTARWIFRAKPILPPVPIVRDEMALSRFAKRKHVALVIALTPAQEKDAAIAAHAKTLEAFYEKKGRHVTIGTAAPGGVVESLQPLRSPNRFPQWKTVAADLVLFGTPADNVLLLDQARAYIFPRDAGTPAKGRADVIYTRSPFVGEYDVVNVIAGDAAGVGEAVKEITAER